MVRRSTIVGVLLALALLAPAHAQEVDPFTEPRDCRAQEAAGSADVGYAVFLFFPEGWGGYRAWGSTPITLTLSSGTQGPSSLTEWLTVVDADRFVNTTSDEPFTVYVCAPGDLPPFGGYRMFAPLIAA